MSPTALVGPDELARVDALRSYQLLDAPAGDELEAVVRIAAAVAGKPFATLNLIDENRQCQLATTGFEGQDSARDDSMCAVHFQAGEVVVLPDARLDPRFAANPWVDGRLAEVRFYASAPLVTAEGHALGSLCVFDTAPGSFDDDQLDRLRDLSGVVLALFERRRQAREQAQLAAEAEQQRALATSALQLLAERQTVTDTMLDTVDVGIVGCRPDGRLTLFNRTAREWHDLDADDALDPAEHPVRYGLFAADGRTPLGAEDVPLHRALVDGAVDAVEMVIAPEHLPAVRVVASGRRLVADDGSCLGAVVAMRDVNHDREREQALASAHDELLRSNHELELFAAVAGHDLSSPLTAIAGYVELLGDVYGEALDDRGREWIETVQRSTVRMKSLITALLGYASVGAVACRRERVDLREVVDGVLADLRVAVRDSDARVHVDGPLPVLASDATLVHQLLQNLLGNAMKYRRPGVPCEITISARPDPAGWLVAVRDNGAGVPEEARERVFGVFERIEGRAAVGHGLGLATCRRIVERQGGRIWIGGPDDSTPDAVDGPGTTVCFTLPA